MRHNMGATLEARLRAREKRVTVDGHTFTIRRPKAADLIQPLNGLDLVRKFTVGWDLLGSDLVPGGNPEPEPFSPELFADYVEDTPSLWEPLASAINDMWREHESRIELDAKN